MQVEMPWYGSFCQNCLVELGASMSCSSILTTTGKAKQPGLVLAFREAGALWVEEDLFFDFVESLSDEEFAHITLGNILFVS